MRTRLSNRAQTASPRSHNSRVKGGRRWVVVAALVSVALGVATQSPRSADAAEVQPPRGERLNGSVSVTYARVDAVAGSEITLTVIEGTATGSGAIVLGKVLRPRTEMLPASSKALIKGSLVGKVVRVEGFPSLYVRTWWTGWQYLKESTYDLNATLLTVYSGSSCVNTTQVRVKIRFAVDPSLRFSRCSANGITWIYTKGGVEYDILSVKSVSGTWFLKTTPVSADRWTRTAASWSPGDLEVMYDVRRDGKPPFAVTLGF